MLAQSQERCFNLEKLVMEKQEAIDALRSQAKHSKIIELESAKEENFAEVLRLRQLLHDQGFPLILTLTPTPALTPHITTLRTDAISSLSCPTQPHSSIAWRNIQSNSRPN
jgi:hypothetical protein